LQAVVIARALRTDAEAISGAATVVVAAAGEQSRDHDEHA
jgi:hypothetical protein